MDSIEKINQIIQSMESKVEANNTADLERLLSGLSKDISDNRRALTLVKMMQSLGKYLSTRTHNAHPETVPCLASLSRDLDVLLLTPSMSQGDQEAILARGNRTFKALKAKIAKSPLVSEEEIEELKAVILSVDWEISSVTLKNFDRVFSRLKNRLQSNKVHFTFLRIMHSIGGHIAQNKALAHKDSIALLRWVFQHYEQLVVNPDMSTSEKKRIVEMNIQAYNAFKNKITEKSAPVEPALQPSAPTPVQPPAHETISVEEESLPPALSHVSAEVSMGGAAPLSTLTDEEAAAQPLAGVDNEPMSMTAGQAQEAPQRDVMGDLFSMKESPADELLDAIHLADMHGPDQETAAGMPMPGALGQDEQKPGVKNFTPKRMDKDPIPEIENRLDAFFNLDMSQENATLQPVPQQDDPPGDESIPVSDSTIPVEDMLTPEPVAEAAEETQETDALAQLVAGDEIPGEQIPDDGIELVTPLAQPEESTWAQAPAPEQDLAAVLSLDDTILDGIKRHLEDPTNLASERALEEVQEDIFRLTQTWADDPDKLGLLELLSALSRFIHDREKWTEKETIYQVVPEDIFDDEDDELESVSETDTEENDQTLIAGDLFESEDPEQDALEQDETLAELQSDGVELEESSSAQDDDDLPKAEDSEIVFDPDGQEEQAEELLDQPDSEQESDDIEEDGDLEDKDETTKEDTLDTDSQEQDTPEESLTVEPIEENDDSGTQNQEQEDLNAAEPIPKKGFLAKLTSMFRK